MKKLLFALLFLASPAYAQTQTQYYTVPTIAALKAMTTSRPAVVQVVDANPGIFNLSSGACSAADDVFQVQPTAGTTVCYTRAATPYSVGKSATNNGVLVTSGTGVPSISTALPTSVTTTATGGSSAITVANRFSRAGLTPQDFGAVCDGTTNDATALQSWLSAGSTTQPLAMTAATCAFSTALTLTNPNGLSIEGVGPYSVLRYTGASTTADLITIGDTSGSVTNRIYLANFKINSATTMTSGQAIRIKKANEVVVQNVTLHGIEGTSTLWGGIWSEQSGNIQVFGGFMRGKGTLIKVNGGTIASGNPRAEFLLASTRIVNDGTTLPSVHVGGGFGGFTCDAYTSVSGGLVGLQIDTTLTAEGNREIYQNPGCIIDASAGVGVKIDDAGPVTGGGGNINLLGWIASSSSHGVQVVNWAAGWITIANGPVINSGGDNIRLQDTTASYVIGTMRNTGATGWGVNCTVALTTVAYMPGPSFAANGSGNTATNCAPVTAITGALNYGGVTAANSTTGTGSLVLGTNPTVTIIAAGTTTARSLAARFGTALSPLDFGAVCNGVTDDLVAMNLWMAAILSTGKEGVLPAGSCTFSAPLTPIARHGISIVGQGKGVSELKYIGASTTPGNLITFGTQYGGSQYLNLYGFSIGSTNALTTGAAIRVRSSVVVDIDVDFNGLAGNQGNLFNGLYLDSVTNTTLNASRFYTAGTAVMAHTGVELHMGSAFVLATQNTTSIGVHVGGQFGGWYGEQMGQILAHIGILVDNSLTNRSGTGNTTNTSTTLSSLTVDTSTVDLGWFVTGTDIPNGAYITAINSYNSVTISAAATGTTVGGTVNIQRLASIANTTNTSPVVTNISSMSTGNLTVNMAVSGTGIPSGAYIISVDSPTQVTLSANATATTTGVQLIFTPGNNQFFFGAAAFDSNRDAGAYFNDSVYNPVGKSIDMQTGWIASTSNGNGFVIVNWAGGSFNSAGGTYGNIGGGGSGIVLDDPTTKVRIGSAARISDNSGYGIYATSPITIYYSGLPFNNTLGNFSANVTAITPPITSASLSSILTSDLTLRGGTALSVIIGVAGSSSDLYVQSAGVVPGVTNAMSMGGGSNRWSNVYSVLGNFSGALTYGGVTLANSVTGTGSMVLSASPTLTGTLTASAITTSSFLTLNSNSGVFSPISFVDANAGGKTWSMGPGGGGSGAGNFGLYNVTNSNQVFTFSSTGALTLPAALTYGGVTLANSVTGTGSMVLSASPTLTGTVTASTYTATTATTAFAMPIGNANVIGQSAVTSHLAGNAGSVTFGIADGGGFAGVKVTNVWGGTYSSQRTSILCDYGGVFAATECTRFEYDGSVVLGLQSANATTNTTGYVYIRTSAGAPTGVPTAYTGMVALQYDTTNKKLWVYDGGWLQPKTPAGAAIVTWQ